LLRSTYIKSQKYRPTSKHAPHLHVYTPGHENRHGKHCTISILIYTGQFWNIPIDVVRYNQSIDGAMRSDAYTITVNYPDQRRQFVGFLYPLTWEYIERQCLYVGNGQGGPTEEVDNPNDPVLQGEYTDFIVNDIFGMEFKYTHFDSSRCSIESTTSPESTAVPPEGTTPLPESTTAHAENSNVVAIASVVAAVGSVIIIFIAIFILVVNVIRRHQAQFNLHKEDR